jgi:hypothetical protein
LQELGTPQPNDQTSLIKKQITLVGRTKKEKTSLLTSVEQAAGCQYAISL